MTLTHTHGHKPIGVKKGKESVLSLSRGLSQIAQEVKKALLFSCWDLPFIKRV